MRRLVALLVAVLCVSPAFAYETLARGWRNGRATYRINPNFPDTGLTGTRAQQIEMFRSAADAWRNQSSANFQFIYDGETSRVGQALSDGVNSVGWLDDDDPEALALTWLRIGSGGRVAGFDMVFLDRTGGEKNRWNGPRDPGEGTIDLMGVAVHEFGHALGLDHTPIVSATMYDSIVNRGVHLRTLHDDDLAGVHFLYGSGRPGADPSPVIESVSPDNGPGDGGNEVVIRGVNFTWTQDTTLRIDGTPMSRELWEVESLGLIRVFFMPPHETATVPIALDNALGIDALPSAYRYGPASPVLLGVDPELGPLTGGVPVRVLGRHFTADAQVTIGGSPLEEPELLDSGTLEGLLPPSSQEGAVDVVLTQGPDTDEIAGGFSYTAMVLAVEDATAPREARAWPVDVRATTPVDLVGVSFGLVYETGDLSVADVVVEGTASEEALFSSPNIDNTAGVTTLGIVMDIVGAGQPIPAGDDVLVAKVLVDIDPESEPGAFIDLRLEDSVGQPPIELFFTPDGGAEKSVPFTIDGRVTVTTGPKFVRGDVNGDGDLNLADPVFILDALFRQGPLFPCPDAADGNDDGRIDVSDAVRVLVFLFAGGEPPPPPHPDEGEDPTTDNLRC